MLIDKLALTGRKVILPVAFLIMMVCYANVYAGISAIENKLIVLTPISIDQANLDKLSEKHEPIIEILGELLEAQLVRGIYETNSYRSNQLVYAREYATDDNGFLLYPNKEAQSEGEEKIIINTANSADLAILPRIKTVVDMDFAVSIDVYNLDSSKPSIVHSIPVVISAKEGLRGIEKQLTESVTGLVMKISTGELTAPNAGIGTVATGWRTRSARIFRIGCFNGAGKSTSMEAEEFFLRRLTLVLPGILTEVAKEQELDFQFQGLSLYEYADSCLSNGRLSMRQLRHEGSWLFDYEIFGEVVFRDDKAFLTSFIFSREKSYKEKSITDVLLRDIQLDVLSTEEDIRRVARRMMEELNVLKFK